MDKFIGNAKEKFFYHNTLLCLVKSLQKKTVTIDLRNDSYICGIIVSVDGFMNISLSNCVYCDPQGNEYLFEYLFLHARNIRYVHIPETVSILSSIKGELIHNKPLISQSAVKSSRKATKARKQHMETVASLETKK